jgi:hypothetical protein
MDDQANQLTGTFQPSGSPSIQRGEVADVANTSCIMHDARGFSQSLTADERAPVKWVSEHFAK